MSDTALKMLHIHLILWTPRDRQQQYFDFTDKETEAQSISESSPISHSAKWNGYLKYTLCVLGNIYGSSFMNG